MLHDPNHSLSSSAFNQRLQELGLVLPKPPAPVASYAPTLMQDGWLYVSGQLPMVEGKPVHIGKVGQEISVAEARDAARICALNTLSQVSAALGGDMSRLLQCVKVTGFVNAMPTFSEHPKVIDGASTLLVDILGEVGRSTRSAVGVGSLPFNVAVEVETIFRVRPID